MLAEKIRERASSGKGLEFSKDGSASEVKLKSPYSKTYSESLDFIAAGKSKSDVNMSLTGDMLASVQVEDRGGNKIAVYIDGETEVLKAYNHITGDTVPKRPFFGVSKKDVKEVVSDFESEIESIDTREGSRTRDQRRRTDLLDTLAGVETARRRPLRDVLNDLSGDDDE
jgi:hypothetical protein